MTPVACANCGKLIAASDTRCFNCGAVREASAEPELPPSMHAHQRSGEPILGCIGGVVLVIVLTTIVGAIFSIPALMKVLHQDPTVYVMLALGVVAVALIPALFPYGRRLPVLVRWMLGTACVLLIFGLGAFAACMAMFSNTHF